MPGGCFRLSERPCCPTASVSRRDLLVLALRVAATRSAAHLDWSGLLLLLGNPFRATPVSLRRPAAADGVTSLDWEVSPELGSSLRSLQTQQKLCWCEHGWKHGCGQVARWDREASWPVVSGWCYITVSCDVGRWAFFQHQLRRWPDIVVEFEECHLDPGGGEHVALGFLSCFGKAATAKAVLKNLQDIGPVFIEWPSSGSCSDRDRDGDQNCPWAADKEAFIRASAGLVSGLTEPEIHNTRAAAVLR